jgi:DNA mismatch endonuclease, patch repair protein
MDIFTKEKRSDIMRKVKGKNTTPELVLFKSFRAAGIKFVKHYGIEGKPDIAFPKIKLAVFVDGDFWHGWKFDKMKLRLPEYWYKKIRNNILRDRKNRRILRQKGWTVIRVWEHRVKKNPEGCIRTIANKITLLTPPATTLRPSVDRRRSRQWKQPG